MDEFIERETEYFRPMLERSERASDRDRARWRQETVRQRHERVSLEVYELCKGVVRYGPFTGMAISSAPWWGKLDLGSQCLGLYEKEILDYLDGVTEHAYSIFIDIGAADGYYAVGMLLSKKVDHAVCFEMSAAGQSAIRENWSQNQQPGLLEVFGEATPDSLCELLPGPLENGLVLVDIEGAEFELLTDAVLFLLSKSTVIVEIHNWIDDFITQYVAMIMRIGELFDIDVIERKNRNTDVFEELRDFTDDNRALLASESRPCVMRFLRLTPKDDES